jgi:hypothetical protein
MLANSLFIAMLTGGVAGKVWLGMPQYLVSTTI